MESEKPPVPAHWPIAIDVDARPIVLSTVSPPPAPVPMKMEFDAASAFPPAYSPMKVEYEELAAP